MVHDQVTDREQTLPESSTSRNPLSLFLDKIDNDLKPVGLQQQANYEKVHTVAKKKSDDFLQKKAIEKVQAENAAKSEEGQEYASRQKEIAKPISRLDAIMARVKQEIRIEPRVQCMDYFDAKKIVTELLLRRLSRENKTLYFNDDQKEVIRDLVAYFIGDPTSNIPLTKGVYLYGDVGVGKSFLMQIMKSFCDVAEIKNMAFREVSTKSLIQEVADEGKLKPIRKYFTGNVFLDDLGEERQDVKLFGNTENPMDLLISERYTAYQEKGFLTHFTSNLPPSKLSIYGTRLFDRFSDMSHSIYLPGGSKRG